MRWISTVLFWMLMVVAPIALWQTLKADPRGSLRTAAFVVPFVLFTFWLESRFSARKRWMARIMIGSAVFAFVSGSIVTWDLTLYRAGFETRGDLIEATGASAVCIACISAFVWSLCRLVRQADKVPT